MDTSEDFQSWVARERLTPDVVKVLEDQGFTSIDTIKMLTPDDIKECFQDNGLLKLAQCLMLKKAVARFSQMSLGSTDSSAQACASTPNQGLLSYPHPSTSAPFPGQSIAPYPTHPQQFGAQPQPEQVYSPHNADGASAWSGNLGTRGSFGGAEECFRFLLLGKTGSGKSTTGNTIFGERLFDTSPSFASVTTDCERKMNRCTGRKIEIIDSPGLYDTHKTHEQICVSIVQAVAGMHPGPHAILYVVRLGRYTEEEYGAYKRLKALFDDSISKHLIVVFTHGDMLEREQMSVQDMIRCKSPEQLLQVLRECNNRYIVFNNMARNPQLQVEQLLQMVRTMVADNGGQPYSCPKYGQIGVEVEEEVARRLHEVEKRDLQRQKYVQQLERQTKVAEDEAQRTRELYEKNEEERQRRMQEDEAKRQKWEEQLQAQIREQQNSLEKHQQELQRVHQEQERMLKEKEQEMTERERQRAEEAAEKMKEREQEIMALVEKQKEQLARQTETGEEKRQQMEEERQKYLQELEEQRKKDIEQLEKRDEERRLLLEQQLEMERQAAKRKEEEYEKQLEILKEEITAKQRSESNINWSEFMVNAVNLASGLLGLWGYLQEDRTGSSVD